MRKFLPILVAFIATHAFAVNEFYDLLIDHSQKFKSGATLDLTGVSVIGLSGAGTVTSVGADTSSTGFAITGSPVTSAGTLHINLAAGYVVPTSTNIATWNGKQDALGFTPENIANKDVDGTLSANSDTKYPSQKAVKTYADTKVPKTTTVNGHALSGNISVTPADLSLVIGTNVEAWSANLDSWSAKTPFAGSLAITTGKTFTATNTLTLSGTDASTLNIGTGGTLGTAAFTASSAYEPAITAGSTAQYWRGDKSFQTLNATAVGLGSVENAAASTLYVPLTRTVNSHALSSNVTVTDSDLGATTIGDSVFKLTNPSAVTFPRFNADNTVSALSASAFRTAIGAGTSSFDGAFSSLIGIPTTLSGYGITDAVSNTRTVNGHALSGNVSVTASDVSLGSVTNDAQTKAAIIPNTAPTAGQILAGNAGGTAYAPVSLSGSGATASFSSAGVLTLSAIPNTTLSNSAITIAGTSTALGSSITLNTILGFSVGQLSTWAGITPGTGVGTALGVNIGSAGAFVVNGGAGGTPSSLTLTNATGLPESGVTSLVTDLSAKQSKRVYDVKDYGAVGDGATDDTTAISNAITAIPSTGGVLYFPSSSSFYKATSGFTFSKPISVVGDGAGGPQDLSTVARSTVSFSTTTGTLFTVTSNGCTFQDIQLDDPSGTTPTGGAGIAVTTNGEFTRYIRIRVSGFYDDIDHQTGVSSSWHNVYLANPVRYGLRLRNTANVDGGDWSISDSWFHTGAARSATSALRVESGGGLKFVNNKINALSGGGSIVWTNGIDFNLAASVVSGDVLISNNSIEGYGATGSGILFNTADNTSSYQNITITGNQISAFGTTNSGSAISFNSTAANQYNRVALTGNVAYANPSSTGTAYKFTNVNTIRFDLTNISGNYTTASSFTGCTSTGPLLQNAQIADGAMAYGLRIDNVGAAYNSSPLSGIGFAVQYDAAGDLAGMGGISIGKENSTDADYSSFLDIYTRRNGSAIAKAARFSSLRAFGMTAGSDAMGNTYANRGISGGALELMYDPTNSTSTIASINEGVAWKHLNYQAADHNFYLGGASSASFGINSNGHVLVEGVTSTGATGTGNFVFDTSPAFVTPALGTPASGVVTNLTGTASININGTVGATTPAAGTFTTATASTSVTAPIIKPASNSTTALQVTKADGTTRVVDVDTTNARVGINKTPGAYDLDVNGAENVGGTLFANKIISGASTDPSLGQQGDIIASRSANTGVYYFGGASGNAYLYFDASNIQISKTLVPAADATFDLGSTGNRFGNAFIAGTTKTTTLNIASGGSTTISTGVGSVKMSTANAATNTVWIPIQYAGTTYYVPGFTTNAP